MSVRCAQRPTAVRLANVVHWIAGGGQEALLQWRTGVGRQLVAGVDAHFVLAHDRAAERLYGVILVAFVVIVVVVVIVVLLIDSLFGYGGFAGLGGRSWCSCRRRRRDWGFEILLLLLVVVVVVVVGLRVGANLIGEDLFHIVRYYI